MKRNKNNDVVVYQIQELYNDEWVCSPSNSTAYGERNTFNSVGISGTFDVDRALEMLEVVKNLVKRRKHTPKIRLAKITLSKK